MTHNTDNESQVALIAIAMDKNASNSIINEGKINSRSDSWRVYRSSTDLLECQARRSQKALLIKMHNAVGGTLNRIYK